MATEIDASLPGGWCLFRSEERPYAVKIGSVAEVVRVERLVRLPFAPARLVGLCTLRRNVIPVFRPLADESGRPTFTDGKSLVLLIRAANGIWGLLIDREGLQVREGIPVDDFQPNHDSTPDRVFVDRVSHAVIDPDHAGMICCSL